MLPAEYASCYLVHHCLFSSGHSTLVCLSLYPTSWPFSSTRLLVCMFALRSSQESSETNDDERLGAAGREQKDQLEREDEPLF